MTGKYFVYTRGQNPQAYHQFDSENATEHADFDSAVDDFFIRASNGEHVRLEFVTAFVLAQSVKETQEP